MHNKTPNKPIALAFATFVLSSLVACSTPSGMQAEGKQQKGPHHGMHGDRLDKNGDGKISREEAAAFPRLAQQFDQIDANRDGSLDREEMAAHHQAMMADHHRNLETRFQQADSNGDGGLTLEEAKAGKIIPVVHHFAELDADKDGKVTMAELKAAGLDQGRHGGRGHHGKQKMPEPSKYY